MTAIDRAEADLQHGDFAMARQRLESYLRTRGYDAALMSRIGQIAFDMRDPFSAGRFWLLSSATGLEVDRTIALLARRLQNDPARICEAMPLAARLVSLDDYPHVARGRVERLGLAKHLPMPPTQQQSPPTLRRRMTTALVGIAMAAALLTGLTSCVVGAKVVARWLFQ